MPMILLKSVAGLFTGVAVGALSLAFWPQVQPTTVAARPVVEQPAAGRAIGASRRSRNRRSTSSPWRCATLSRTRRKPRPGRRAA